MTDKNWAASTGYFLYINGDYWMFMWGGELLAVRIESWGWQIQVKGVDKNFESLWEALEWWDDWGRFGIV